MPRVSVLMPLYNTQEEHLCAAIESILHQSFADFELLLLNDSPDNARLAEIAARYADPRIRFCCNESNLGITPSRNKLMDMASGEYLAIMDHDDISLPQRLEKQVAYLDAHPEAGVVGCWVEEFPSRKTVRMPEDDHSIRLFLMYGCAIYHSASMVRREVLEAHGIRYEASFSPSEDYALWCRLMPHTRFHNIPEVLFRYRLYEGNTSKKQKGRMDDTACAIRARVRAENPALYQEYLMRARDVTRIRLFGVIPLLTIQRRGNRATVYLFEFLPLYTAKRTIKM